jgi:hypothetical protein
LESSFNKLENFGKKTITHKMQFTRTRLYKYTFVYI